MPILLLNYTHTCTHTQKREILIDVFACSASQTGSSFIFFFNSHIIPLIDHALKSPVLNGDVGPGNLSNHLKKKMS